MARPKRARGPGVLESHGWDERDERVEPEVTANSVRLLSDAAPADRPERDPLFIAERDQASGACCDSPRLLDS